MGFLYECLTDRVNTRVRSIPAMVSRPWCCKSQPGVTGALGAEDTATCCEHRLCQCVRTSPYYTFMSCKTPTHVCIIYQRSYIFFLLHCISGERHLLTPYCVHTYTVDMCPHKTCNSWRNTEHEYVACSWNSDSVTCLTAKHKSWTTEFHELRLACRHSCIKQGAVLKFQKEEHIWQRVAAHVLQVIWVDKGVSFENERRYASFLNSFADMKETVGENKNVWHFKIEMRAESLTTGPLFGEQNLS